MLLLAAGGVEKSRIAEALELSVNTVRSWRERCAVEGLARLGEVRAGRGRKPSITEEQIAEIVRLTLHSSRRITRIGAAARWRPASG